MDQFPDDLVSALRAWMQDNDHLTDGELDEPRFENGPGPVEAALLRAARAYFQQNT